MNDASPASERSMLREECNASLRTLLEKRTTSGRGMVAEYEASLTLQGLPTLPPHDPLLRLYENNIEFAALYKLSAQLLNLVKHERVDALRLAHDEVQSARLEKQIEHDDEILSNFGDCVNSLGEQLRLNLSDYTQGLDEQGYAALRDELRCVFPRDVYEGLNYLGVRADHLRAESVAPAIHYPRLEIPISSFLLRQALPRLEDLATTMSYQINALVPARAVTHVARARPHTGPAFSTVEETQAAIAASGATIVESLFKGSGTPRGG